MSARRLTIAAAVVVLGASSVPTDSPAAPSSWFIASASPPPADAGSLRPAVPPRGKPKTRPIGRRGRLQWVTEYCWTGSRTTNDHWPRIGIAATLDRHVPFGTRLRVQHVGVVVVDDRVGHGTDIDIYAGRGPDCERRAARWGRRRIRVEVLGAAA